MMASEINLNEISDDLWDISNSVLENYKEENALKHLKENAQLRTDRFAGFDNNSGDTWIYPTNYPVRKYQHDIVYKALFKNTLVCLPTGLGKTFIAAVVMYNFYRWYPQGKVIFMAPTRPLVAQQIEACYRIMGISKDDTAEITGQQKKENRLRRWQLGRVFYATPQSVVSDIDDPNFPIDSIKLVVFDEAHKAKGKYAYCDVIRIIKEKNEMFRVLALSATPGRRNKDVAEVVYNLLISHIEVRTEKCADVVPYIHRKQIETIVVHLSGKIQQFRNELLNIIDPHVQTLIKFNVIDGSTNSLSKAWLLYQKLTYERDRIIQKHPNHSEVMTTFSICICLYHALELLERHGMWQFMNFFDSPEEKFVVAMDFRLKHFLNSVRQDIGSYPLANDVVDAQIPVDFDFGHPKYNELQKCLLKHFTSSVKSQAIVFCEFRDSASLIHQMLLQNNAVIKPAIFIGQGSTTTLKGITQKQQIATMADFRKGVYNVLIATSVAEEGIDCGEVDLIVCFDVVSKNPTRLIQRMGRTGRKRNGRVILLVTEGKEQNNLKESMTASDFATKKLVTHSEVVDCLCPSPRLVPSEFNPKCVETFIHTGAEIDPNEFKKSEDDVHITSDKRSTYQQPTSSRDMRNFFAPISTEQTVFANRSERPSNIIRNYGPPVVTPSKASDTKFINTNETLQIPTFWEVLRGNNTSDALKAFAVKRNIDTWQEKLSTKTLSSVDESAILTSIKDITKITQLINCRQRNRTKIPMTVELNCRNESYDPIFSAKLTERLAQVKKVQKLDESEEKNISDELIEQMNDSSTSDFNVGESQSFNVDAIGSKYELLNGTNESKFFTSSTPVKVKETPLTSSTPLNSRKKGNKISNSVKDSPLARAFERCKSLNKTKKKALSSNDELALYGLSDICDLFEDSDFKADDVGAKEATITSTHSDNISECLLNLSSHYGKASDSTCIKTSPVVVPNQESQGYTVSQILKIVNVDKDTNLERSENGHMSVRKNVSVPKRTKAIDIGTIEEIFGLDDDNIETDLALYSDKPSASEEDEVIASSQSVISKFKLPSKFENKSAENDYVSMHKKSTLAHSGDDMFASFLTTKSSISSPSNLHQISNSHLMQSNYVTAKTSQLPSIEEISEVNQTTDSTKMTTEPTSKDIDCKSPSSNSNLLQKLDRSPSLFSRKINLSRLTSLSKRSNSEMNPPKRSPHQSPVFFSCVNPEVNYSQKNNDPESKVASQPHDIESQIDESFTIHRNPNKRNRVINDTILEEYSQKRKICKSREIVFKKPRMQKCAFLDDECDASDASSDEIEDSLDAGLNSIICNEEDVHDDTSVDMRAIYLQSVKSPARKNGFKFSNRNVYSNNADIFSQAVVEDNDSDYDTSFVVDECSEESEQEMSVLERAEKLLKMQKKAKRKLSNNNSEAVKRRKIIVYDDSSDENT